MNDKTVTEKRRDKLAGHLSRKHQVAATQAFAIKARREISDLPDRVRFAVAALCEFERLEADAKIRDLTRQVDALKLHNLRLKAALAFRSSPAPALAVAVAEATEGQMVRAVPDDHETTNKW